MNIPPPGRNEDAHGLMYTAWLPQIEPKSIIANSDFAPSLCLVNTNSLNLKASEY